MELENATLKAELEAAQGLVQVQNKLHAATMERAAETQAETLDKAAKAAKAAAKVARTEHAAELKRRQKTAEASEAKLLQSHLLSRQELQRQRSEAQTAQREAEGAQRKVEQRAREDVATAAVERRVTEELAREQIAHSERALQEAKLVARALIAAAEDSCAELRVELEAARAARAAELEAARTEIHSLRTSNGRLASEGENLRASARQCSPDLSGSQRNLLRREKELRAELDLAREALDEARTKLSAAKEQVSGPRECAGRHEGAHAEEQAERIALPLRPQVTLEAVRNSGSEHAVLTTRTLEMLRAIVEDGNCSFEAASALNAHILNLHMGLPPRDRLFSSSTFKRAFMVLGEVDNAQEAEDNRREAEYYAVGGDIGNYNRAINLMVYSCWQSKRDKPLARPLAASDMCSDQSAKNGAAVMLEGSERLGLSPDLCVAVCTDGADAAMQEGEGYLEAQHAKSSKSTSPRLSVRSTCCIHGKALEENTGMERAAEVLKRAPDVLVDALRLLWEMIRCPIMNRCQGNIQV